MKVFFSWGKWLILGMRSTSPILALLTCLFMASQVVAAGTFYVDPISGSAAGDGSAANPWKTLEEVFGDNLIESQKPAVYPYNGTLQSRNLGAPIKAGDTIKLRSGYHGKIFESGYFNSEIITIEADAGHTPELHGFTMRGAENWALRGLTVSPELAGVIDTGSIVKFETHNWHGPASNMSIEDSTIYSTADSSAWTAADWTSKAAHGIQVNGSNFQIRNNTITNVNFGILTGGDDILAESNTIRNFAGDGMRGGGDRVTYQYNTIKGPYDVDGNHDDGIQFFQGHGVPSYDVVLRGNYIETFADPAHPLMHGSQGLGMFDGPYIDWIVENNVVMTTAAFHGISLYDAENAQVVNNTVLDITGQSEPWILLNDSTNSTMRNNLAFKHLTTGSSSLTSDHNITLNNGNLDAIFEDWQNGVLRLKDGSLAIDAGSNTLAPASDIDGRPRPIGASVDIGAFEYALSGDFDSDGDVDGSDFLLWQLGLGILEGAGFSDGDANADGAVNELDITLWQSAYGDNLNSLASAGSSANSVPEPNTCILLAVAISLVSLRMRK
ncbi:MAG: right-handed parallel beta-helix repeat-containing protein [Planctomycetota bacterium]